MDFRIADTFTESLTRLTAQEQKAVKTTAFDLQLNASSPGLSFHKLDRAKDKNFWSVRVNADIRLIVHRTASSLLLAFVDHHDKAYAWAERRRIERHPTTGAMQLVEVRERVEDTGAPSPVISSVQVAPKPKLFGNLRKIELMAFGVPEDWVEDARNADEDTIFDVIAHLPQEAQEALLKLAVGEKVEPPPPATSEADPFAHPDAQRRFRVLKDVDELRRALDAPWDKWAVFLHPSQASLVSRIQTGPARVSGSAGTGKTIVALHRAVYLARKGPDARVLLTTFSQGLASALARRLTTLLGDNVELSDRITVKALSTVANDLYTESHGLPRIASSAVLDEVVAEAAAAVPGHAFTLSFLRSEWNDVVDAWQLRTWEAYRDVSRLGRKTRIGGKQRQVLWSIFEHVRQRLEQDGAMTAADMLDRLSQEISDAKTPRFDHAVIDEAQDLGIAEARFLIALVGPRPDGLFFAGDVGQRIFQQPFSWRSLGLDVRGRATTLKVNYRTSHQIRTAADRLLPGNVSDVDGNSESRRGTISMFDGPIPKLGSFKSQQTEQAAVAEWIRARLAEGCAPHEVSVIVRSDSQIGRARSAVSLAKAKGSDLDDGHEPARDHIAIGTMHLAKGLEFKCVVVMACDDEVIPQQERIESVVDEADLKEVYDTERHLLYVACTRARDQLLVTGTEPVSEFISDMGDL